MVGIPCSCGRGYVNVHPVYTPDQEDDPLEDDAEIATHTLCTYLKKERDLGAKWYYNKTIVRKFSRWLILFKRDRKYDDKNRTDRKTGDGHRSRTMAALRDEGL